MRLACCAFERGGRGTALAERGTESDESDREGCCGCGLHAASMHVLRARLQLDERRAPTAATSRERVTRDGGMLVEHRVDNSSQGARALAVNDAHRRHPGLLRGEEIFLDDVGAVARQERVEIELVGELGRDDLFFVVVGHSVATRRTIISPTAAAVATTGAESPRSRRCASRPSANAIAAVSASATTPALPSAITTSTATPTLSAAVSHAGAGVATSERGLSSSMIGSPSACRNAAAQRPTSAVATNTPSQSLGAIAKIAAARISVENTSTRIDVTLGAVACSPSMRATRPRSTSAADASERIARPTIAPMLGGMPAASSSAAATYATTPIGTPSATSQNDERASPPIVSGHRHGVE